MKTETLDEFVVVAKHLSFTAAAKELFVSQPSLSSHINSLEKELGFSLFVRSGSRLHLTQAGSVFLESTQKTLAVLLDGWKRSKDVATELPPVSIATLPFDSPYYLALIRFKELPFIFVDVGEEMTAFKALEKDIVDIGTHFDYTDIPELKDQADALGIGFIPAGYGSLSISVMNTHPLATKEHPKRADLQNLKVTITSGAHYDSWRLLVIKTLGDDLGLEFNLNQLRSIRNLAFLNMGDSAHVCNNSDINACFAGRDDIVTFDMIDGKRLLYPDGFVYKKENKQAESLLLALKKHLRTLPHPS
jgi:DNA-binding transcriptional LysR family regulator